MKTIRTIEELRASMRAPRRAGQAIGLVPTMGSLHEGHLSLIRRARAQCSVVVMSLFVNPAQFEDQHDLVAYPRDEGRDAALAAEAGVDYVFAPAPAEIYPSGFATTVSVAGVSETLEGAHRGRSHFDGVATVLTKLFNIVAPDVAYFGQKDAQQVAVIRRLVADLDIPVRIEVCPTVRDRDGLALSSRNARLSASDRARATALHRAMAAAHAAVDAGERDAAVVTATARAELAADGIAPEYIELVDAETMIPIERIDERLHGGQLLAVVAARVGAARLLDNEPISIASPANAANDLRDRFGSLDAVNGIMQVNSSGDPVGGANRT